MAEAQACIQIVDDTESARETLGDLLSTENYRLIFAENGQQAIGMARQEQPDLILLDVMMPGMDGFEVCRYIRQDEELSEVPIILVTALDDKDSFREGIQAGADDFITKPYDRQTLRLRVRTVVKLNRFRKLSQIRQQKQDAEQKAEQEKALSKLKSEFISLVSHEFRTPLAAINFAASFMLKYGDKLDTNKRAQKLEKILAQVGHMTNLLNDVLAIGRNEAGKVKTLFETVELDTFIEPIVDEVAQAFNNTHTINCNMPKQTLRAELDTKIAREIFTNLLSNAIKFSQHAKSVDLTIRQQQNAFLIEVRDYGIGIPKKDLKEILEPFQRGSNVNTIQGTGLGLKIVKDAVELHNGELKIESKEGEGTRICVVLPTQQAATTTSNNPG